MATIGNLGGLYDDYTFTSASVSKKNYLLNQNIEKDTDVDIRINIKTNTVKKDMTNITKMMNF